MNHHGQPVFFFKTHESGYILLIEIKMIHISPSHVSPGIKLWGNIGSLWSFLSAHCSLNIACTGWPWTPYLWCPPAVPSVAASFICVPVLHCTHLSCCFLRHLLHASERGSSLRAGAMKSSLFLAPEVQYVCVALRQ